LSHRGPDAVGLKDVAREAGVSHALVTHYFRTIDRVIDAALESVAEGNRRVLTGRILGGEEGPRAWMDQWFEWVTRPEAARFLAWSFLTGRTTRSDFFSRRTRGLKQVADAIEERLAAEFGSVPLSRQDLEFVLLLLMAAPFGYAIGRDGYWAGLGVDRPGEKEDRFFFDRLAELVEGTLRQRIEAADG
jgi:AcrR family transcriptional regulator